MCAVLALAAALAASPACAQSLYSIDSNFSSAVLWRGDANGIGGPALGFVTGALPEGIAVDAAGRVYWSEATLVNAQIRRAAADLSGDLIILNGEAAIRGLAVDGAGGHIYWTTSRQVAGGATVRRALLDGTGVQLIVTLAPGANPRGIAVDHAAGKLYWADVNLGLYRSNLDGTSVEHLFVASAPFGVAVDGTAGFVYWTEYVAGVIRRVKTDLSGSVANLPIGAIQPNYLALDPAGNRLFWVQGTGTGREVHRSNLDGSMNVVLGIPMSTQGGIAYFPGGTAATDDAPPPAEISLDRVWPSPGTGPLHVAFSLPRASRVRLDAFDLQGRMAARIADGTMPAGRHERTWDTAAGRAAAGVYFLRMTAGDRVFTRRIVLSR